MPRFILILLSAAALICSCNPTEAPDQEAYSDPKRPAAEFNDPIDDKLYAKGDILYAWVEGLSVRAKPATSAERLGRVTPSEPLTFTGNRSADSLTLIMRGSVYREPWYEITTADQKNGWVFGGGVKRKGERKGNAPLTGEKFSFPGFGEFNLAEWETISNTGTGDNPQGDTSRETVSYRKEDQVLRITRISAGEYGYRDEYRLEDTAGNLQKRRVFAFEVLPDMLLTELVEDHLSTPPVAYRRSQVMDKHYLMLGDRPVMARGSWTEGPVEKREQAPDAGR